jgi:copper chaperone NosL
MSGRRRPAPARRGSALQETDMTSLLRRVAGCARLGLLPALAASLAGCAPGPVPIALGADRCVDCARVIRDKPFAAQAATPAGRVYKFDSVECLADWIGRHPDQPLGSAWVADYEQPLRMIPAASAIYLPTASARDPRARLAAYAPTSAAAARRRPGVTPLRWPQLQEAARRRLALGAGAAAGGR